MEETPQSKALVWPIHKYARLQSTDTAQSHGSSMEPKIFSQHENQWTLFCSDNDDLKLTVTSEQQFVITKGNLILESIFLQNGKTQCRAVAKGDSILFLSKTASGIRLFRVKFGELGGCSGVQQSTDCVGKLSNFITFKANPGTNLQESTTLSSEIGICEMAQAILHPKQYNIPAAYSMGSWNTDELEDSIAFCLADPTFPTFVTTVEKVLQTLSSEQLDNNQTQESTQV